MTTRTDPVGQLTESLRRSLLPRIRSLTERAQLFATIEPEFNEYLESSGYDRVVQKILDVSAAAHKDNVKRVREAPGLQKAFERLRREGEEQPAPLKHMSRQFRQDFHALMEEIQFVRLIDDPEASRGATPDDLIQFIDKLERRGAAR